MTRRAGFTTRATCLLAAGGTAILCGLVFGELDLVRAGVLAVAAPCVAAVAAHSARVRIASKRHLQPTQTQAGQSVTVQLAVTNESMLRTSALMLEDRLPERVAGHARFVIDALAAHETREVAYRVPSLARGRYRVGPLRLRLGDPFGLVDLTRSFTATSEFVVTPAVDPLPAGQPPRSDDVGESIGSRSVGSHGADDQSTREYRTGDDLRKIHWRSSARTGQLMVRQEERPWQGHNTLVLDMRAAAHAANPAAAAGPERVDPRLGSSVEWAVSAAASIGAHLLAGGRRLDLVAGEDATRVAQPDAARLATALADVRTTARGDMRTLTGLLDTAGRDSTLIAVLGRLTAADLRQLAQARAASRSTPAFAVLMDVASWSRPLDAASGAGEAPESDHELSAAVSLLSSAGWRLAIARRGDSTARVWQLLLGGPAHSGRGAQWVAESIR